MSNTLRITLEGSYLDDERTADLSALCMRAASSLMSSRAESLRLIFRSEPFGTSIEPFLGSASLEALLGMKKTRHKTVALLARIAACAFSVCDQVGILLTHEGAAPPSHRMDLSIDALRDTSRLENAWYRIHGKLTWFHLPRIEAKLLQPLALPGGDSATHYFREAWVRALDEVLAREIVAIHVQRDGAVVVSHGEIETAPPPSSRVHPGKNMVTSGRVYFSDPSN